MTTLFLGTSKAKNHIIIGSYHWHVIVYAYVVHKGSLTSCNYLITLPLHYYSFSEAAKYMNTPNEYTYNITVITNQYINLGLLVINTKHILY